MEENNENKKITLEEHTDMRHARVSLLCVCLRNNNNNNKEEGKRENKQSDNYGSTAVVVAAAAAPCAPVI